MVPEAASRNQLFHPHTGAPFRDGRRLAAVQDSTPVIFITARHDLEVRPQALASGCAGYFRKTDPGEVVLDSVRRAGEEE